MRDDRPMTMTNLKSRRRVPASKRSAPGAGACLLAATALLLLAGCASREGGSTVRLQLAECTQLELRLPPGWGHQPTWDLGPRLGLVRLSAKGPETTQILFTPRLNAVPLASAQSQLEQARRELAASGECAAIGAAAPQQRAAAGGVALYCTRAADAAPGATLLPALAGVLVNPRLTVRFKQLDAADEVGTATWAIVDSLRATTHELSP
jgi:hypothetical protein